MKFIIGKKIEMTQKWQGEEAVAVTKVQTGPNVITQVKDEETDGYRAAQIGFGEKKEKNIRKPQKGHMKGLGNFRYLHEFEIAPGVELKRGDIIDLAAFSAGDKIQVTGVSKGKGFQGVVKRHHFSGTKKTHGNKDQLRMPGSVGPKGPAHVFKGTRMGGRMGGDQVTVKNLEVAEIDLENNILYIKGALPGARESLVFICGEGDLKVMQPAKEAEAGKKDEAKAEGKKKEVKPEAAAEEEAKAPVTSEPAKEQPKAEEKKSEVPPASENKAEEKKENVGEAAKAETPEEVEKEVIEAKKKVDAKSDKKE